MGGQDYPGRGPAGLRAAGAVRAGAPLRPRTEQQHLRDGCVAGSCGLAGTALHAPPGAGRGAADGLGMLAHADGPQLGTNPAAVAAPA
ncbi:hypothetical protein MRB53_041951 [Persea americana]|nr:hypothetical protein MRB53_041951 [Persea americana]